LFNFFSQKSLSICRDLCNSLLSLKLYTRFWCLKFNCRVRNRQGSKKAVKIISSSFKFMRTAAIQMVQMKITSYILMRFRVKFNGHVDLLYWIASSFANIITDHMCFLTLRLPFFSSFYVFIRSWRSNCSSFVCVRQRVWGEGCGTHYVPLVLLGGTNCPTGLCGRDTFVPVVYYWHRILLYLLYRNIRKDIYYFEKFITNYANN
jgi:hypothetical protein